MIRLTRRRVLAILAAIGGGTVLGGRAVSVARGEAETAVSHRWKQHPHVHAGSQGPVLEFDSLESGQLRRLVVHVTDDGQSKPLRIVGTFTPPTVPPESALLRVHERTPKDETAPRDCDIDEPTIVERYDNAVDQRRFEITPATRALPLATHQSGDSRTHRFCLVWGISPDSDGDAIPDGTRLELRFESESGGGSEGGWSASGTDTTNRLRTTAREPDDVVRFSLQFSTSNVKRNGHI